MNTVDIPKLNPKLKKSRKVVRRFVPLLLVVAAVVFLAVIHALSAGPNEVIRTIFPGLAGLKSTDEKVNVLLLGIAGGSHDGANLTDTILVASYNLKTHQLYLISIPRDLWIPEYKGKVNAIYEIGLSQNNGLGLAKTVIGNIIGLPLHYALRLDFNGFVKAVDTLGGIDINIDNTFDDALYPISGEEDAMCGNRYQEVDVSVDQAKQLNISPGKQQLLITVDGKIATDSAKEDTGFKYFNCRFERIHFEAGQTHMDGTRALKYVRSRHGTNGEGSDFARSKRQQKVIEAARGKVLSLATLANPGKISDLINAFAQSVSTDIKVSDALEFYKLSKDIKKTDNIVLDDSIRQGLPDGKKSLLYNPPATDYGGAYVLISQDDDYSTIQKYILQELSKEVKGEASAAARTSDQ